MKRVILLLIFLSCCVVSLSSSVSKLQRWKGIKDLNKAKVENVIIDNKGFVSLSPAIDTVFQSTEIFLWDCVYDSKGNLYVSSGNEGKVFKISPANHISTVFTSEKGTEIFALAVDVNGNIYIGESPSGIIHRLSKNGKVEEFFNSGEKYIWKLLFDKKGMLYAATGDGGKLFKISSQGKGDLYYTTKESHIVSLYIYKDRMYVGTEPNGLFIEVVRKNKGMVLYDSKENEVHSIIGIGNMIFFTTVTKPSTLAAPPYMSFFSGVNDIQDDTKMEKSVLYKFNIEKKTVTSLIECPTPPIYSISEYKDGTVMIGTENGRIYLVDNNGRIGQLNRFENSPVLNIVKGIRKNSFFILTGNIGNVIKMGPDISKRGSITTDVFDTEGKSNFGRIDWDVNTPEGTSFSLWLRVGNKEDPDEDWSDWKRMKKGGEINLPPSRFAQIKCELVAFGSRNSPLLKEFSISYLPQNKSPTIKKLIVCPVGVSASEDVNSFFGSVTLLSEKQKDFFINLGYDLPLTLYGLEKGKRCAYWEAYDPDGDSLTFSFFYRGEKEKEWKELKKDINIPAFIWDETAFPDGKYSVKVTVSDERDNPATRALESEFVSEPFAIDNTPPSVEVSSMKVKGKNIEVKVTSKDEISILKSAFYSVNGEEWKIVLPEDGIFDSKKEKFLITVKEKEKGEYTIVVKVTDLALNTGTDKGTIELK